MTRRGELRAAMAEHVGVRSAWAERSEVVYDHDLADDLAEQLQAEPRGLPLTTLARKVHRQDIAVRVALRADPRFVSVGATKGRRWRLRP